MPIAPAIPFTGLAGLRFLDNTFDRQFATFNSSVDIERNVEYFLENAPNATTVDDLMGDRRLLTVVLGAFGLDDDIDKGAFIRKVLEEGTVSNEAFANRLVEPAYREMSAFLGFGDVGGLLIFENTQLNIIDRYRERQFELAVGEQDLNLRLAMNFRREAQKIANETSTEDAFWLRMLGSQPLRNVVESALNLPTQFGLADLDQQIEEIKDRAGNLIEGEVPAAFRDDAAVNQMVDRFLLLQQVAQGATSTSTRGVAALSLLQASALGSGAQAGLFASNFL